MTSTMPADAPCIKTHRDGVRCQQCGHTPSLGLPPVGERGGFRDGEARLWKGRRKKET